jgi:hypothetical protein
LGDAEAVGPLYSDWDPARAAGVPLFQRTRRHVLVPFHVRVPRGRDGARSLSLAGKGVRSVGSSARAALVVAALAASILLAATSTRGFYSSLTSVPLR